MANKIIENNLVYNQMACGVCGFGEYEFYTSGDGYAIRCGSCKNVTLLRITQPKIRLTWGENAQGEPCVFRGRDD